MKKVIISFIVICFLFNITIPSYAFSGNFILQDKITDIIQTEDIVSKDVKKRLKKRWINLKKTIDILIKI